MENQTIKYKGFQFITTRRVLNNGTISIRTVEVRLYEIQTIDCYSNVSIVISHDTYGVLEHSTRDNYFIFGAAGMEDGELYYDFATSIPKILLKELV